MNSRTQPMCKQMAIEWTPFWSVISVATRALLFVFDGLRFRRWAVDDRAGIPRFSMHTETVMLWMVYSFIVSIVIRQTLRHL